MGINAVQNKIQPVQPQTPPAATPAPPEQSGYLKGIQDMYKRQAVQARAQQTQNLNAARLNAQQQSALAGYDPAMASRAMFEQTAGAHQANQGIENALAQYGLDVEKQKYEIGKYEDERDYGRAQDYLGMLSQNGYDSTAMDMVLQYQQQHPGTTLQQAIAAVSGTEGFLKRTPQYEKDTAYGNAEYAWHKQQAEAGNESSARWIKLREAELKQENLDMGNIDYENLSATDVQSALFGASGAQVKAELQNSNQIPHLSTSKIIISNDAYKEIKKDSVVTIDGEIVVVQSKDGDKVTYRSLETGEEGTKTVKVPKWDAMQKEIDDAKATEENILNANEVFNPVFTLNPLNPIKGSFSLIEKLW